MNEQVWWYVARSSGIVAWAVLTLSVVWGLMLSTRLMRARAAPAWLLESHRFLGALGVIFTGVHLGGLVADSYVHFGWAELFVPMASEWQPGAVTIGIVTLYLMLAVELTSLVRTRLPKRLWRAVHLSSLPMFALATWHGLAAGTDVGSRLYAMVGVIAVDAVLFVLIVRITAGRRAGSAARAARTRTHVREVDGLVAGPSPRPSDA